MIRQLAHTSVHLALSLFSLVGTLARAEKVALLDEHEQQARTRIQLMQNESKEINQVYYIYRDDSAGMINFALLRDAARRGVKVRLLIDDWGGEFKLWKNREVLRHLIDEGVEIKVFHPTDVGSLIRSPTSLVKRTHEKYNIFSGQNMAISGDLNMRSKYFGRVLPGKQAMLGREVLIDGGARTESAVSNLNKHFLSIWNSEHTQVIEAQNRGPLNPRGVLQAKRDLDRYLEFAKSTFGDDYRLPKTRDVGELKLVTDDMIKSPSKGSQAELFDRLIPQAEKEVIITNPYILFTERSRKAIADARNRGVRVTVLTNSYKSTDEKWVPPAYVKYLKEMIDMGVEVFEANGEHTYHAKNFVIDGKRTFLTTFNLDSLSEKHNLEIGFTIENEKFAKEVRKSILGDLKNFKRIRVPYVLEPKTISECIRFKLIVPLIEGFL